MICYYKNNLSCSIEITSKSFQDIFLMYFMLVKSIMFNVFKYSIQHVIFIFAKYQSLQYRLFGAIDYL